MHRADSRELNPKPAYDRGTGRPASRSTPLELVSAALAGEGLDVLVTTAAEALGRPVAAVIPTLGEPIAAPNGAIGEQQLAAIVRHTTALVAGERTESPSVIGASMPVRIGQQTLGLVAVIAATGDGTADASVRAWLEAAATAGAVITLRRSTQDGGLDGSERALLQALCAGPPANVQAFVSHASRLGFDLRFGAVAVCARPRTASGSSGLHATHQWLLADLGAGRIYGLVPLASSPVADGDLQKLTDELTEAGMEVAVSAPRRDPGALHDALREAELLLELGPRHGHDHTYRLLVGILFRDPAELTQLREQTISSLEDYDAEHDTELVATLREFLLQDGSTTDTADAMQLHRHTVGYRLTRVHEVSGLSPYESEGRERLSLGLKADQILAANQRLTNPDRLAPTDT